MNMTNQIENSLTIPSESEVVNRLKETPLSMSFVEKITNLVSSFIPLRTLPAKSTTFVERTLPHVIAAVISIKNPREEQLSTIKEFIELYIKLTIKTGFKYHLIQGIQNSLPNLPEESTRVLKDGGEKLENLLTSTDQTQFLSPYFAEQSVVVQNLVLAILSPRFLKGIYNSAKEDTLQSIILRGLTNTLLFVSESLNDASAYALLNEMSEVLFPLFSKTPDQNLDNSIAYLKKIYVIIPDLVQKVCDVLCLMASKVTNISNRMKLVQTLIDMPLDASPVTLKNTFIEIITTPVGVNPKYIKLIIGFLPSLTSVTKFNEDDILKLISRGYLANDVYTNLAITLMENIEESVEKVAEFCVESEEYSAPLLVYLIGRVDPNKPISKSLFVRLVKDQKKYSDQVIVGIEINENFKIRVDHAFDDITDAEHIENVSYFFHNAPYLDYFQNYLALLAQASIQNTELIPCLDIFSSIFANIDCSELIQTLLKSIVEKVLKDQQYIPVEFSHIICHWIKQSDKINEEQLIQIFDQLDFSQIPQGLVILIDAIVRKGTPSEEIDNFITKLAVDTVPKRLARWAVNLIFDTLHQRDDQIKNICKILVDHLSDPDRYENAVRMILEGVKYEADFYETKNPSLTIVFNLKDRNQDVNVTLHPFHSARRVYYEISKQAGIPIESFDLEVESNEDFVPLIYNNSFARINLVKKDKTTILIKDTENELERYVIEPIFINYLKEIGEEQIFNHLDDLNESSSILFQIASLIGPLEGDYEAETPLQELILGNSCNPVDFIGFNKIFPYALQKGDGELIKDEESTKLAEYIVNASFDPISVFVISEAFTDIFESLEFSADLVRKGLIESRIEPLSEMLCTLVNNETSERPFIECMSDAMKNENRAHTFYFFEAMKKLPLKGSFYEPFFWDLLQYEDSRYIDPDQTFIQLLKLIPVSQKTIQLVIQRLFEMPTVKNPIAPFVITEEARSAAFGFLQTKAADKQMIAQFDNIPLVPSATMKISDDLTYRGRTGLYNMRATCYINSVLQCINALPNFSANLLSLSGDSLTPFVIQLRDIIARLRYSVDDVISVRNFAETLIRFNESYQEDTSEFFNQSIVDRLRTDLGQSNPITNEIRGELESKFISKVDGKVYRTVKSEFFHLILPIKGFSNIDEAFREFFKGCELDYAVEEGRMERFKNVPVITKWPNYLIVQLARYEYSDMWERVKLIHEVAFPYALDPNRIAADSGSVPCDTGYELAAVIVHEGEVDSGHYVSIVQGEDGEWYLCNDSNIEYFDVAKMKSWTFGIDDNSSGLREKVWTGYMLFYKRKDIVPIKYNLPPELEEKIDSENSTKWPSMVFNSKLFLDYAMEHVKSSRCTPESIEIATTALLRIATINESILADWCDFFTKTVISTIGGCKTFFNVIEKRISDSLGNIISISDTTEVLLEKLFSSALERAPKMLKFVVILIRCVEKCNARRSCQFMLDLIIESCNYPYDWASEDDALLSIVSYLSSIPSNSNYKLLMAKHHPAALDKLMGPIYKVLTLRGITPAVYALFSIDGINRITSSAKKSDTFLEIVQTIARMRPSLYKDQTNATQQTKMFLQQVQIPETEEEQFIPEMPHVDTAQLWISLSNLVFSENESARNAACSFIKSKTEKVSDEVEDFFNGGFLSEETPVPKFNEESSITHFIFSLIPMCIEIIKTDQSRTKNYLKLLTYVSQTAPLTLSTVLTPLANILSFVDDKDIALLIVSVIVKVAAVLPSFIEDLEEETMDAILSKPLVGKAPVLFVIESKKLGAKSEMYKANINYFLAEESDYVCTLLSNYVREYNAPDFVVPSESCGFEQLVLSIALWDKCKKKRDKLGLYMLNCIRSIKYCPPLVKTDTVKQALTMAKKSAPRETKRLLKEVEDIPWF